MYERAIYYTASSKTHVSIRALCRLYERAEWALTAEQQETLEIQTEQLLAVIERLFELREINRQFRGALGSVGIEYAPVFPVDRLLVFIKGSLSRTAINGALYQRTANFIRPYSSNPCVPPVDDSATSTCSDRSCPEMHTDEAFGIKNRTLFDLYAFERWRLHVQYATTSAVETKKVLAMIERAFDLIEQNREMDEHLVLAGYRFYPEVKVSDLLMSIENSVDAEKAAEYRKRTLAAGC